MRGHVDQRASALVERVAATVDQGTFARGVVIEIRRRGEVIVSCGIGTDGVGAPVGPETLFAVYCTAKPVVAVAIGMLVEAGELSWNDRLGDVLIEGPRSGVPRSVADVTVAQLLTHTAGLHRFSAQAMFRRSPHDRKTIVRQHTPPAGWSPTTDLAYSDFVGGYWQVRIIEALTGEAATTHINDTVLAPLGLSGDIYTGFDPEEIPPAVARCGVNVDLTGNLPVPMLLERSPTFMADPDLASTGGYATVRGLCAFYEGLMGVLGATDDASGPIPRSVIETMVEPAVTGRHDPVLRCDGPWGLGFMVDLRQHFFGEHTSARSFGHSGNSGSSFAFCDPTHDLSVAVLYTAKVDDHYAVIIRRQSFLSQLYEVLELP